MHKLKAAFAASIMLAGINASAEEQTRPPAAAPNPATAPSLTPDDLQKLIDLTQTVGSFPKCRPSICASFGIPKKPLSLMSELRCDMPSGDRASFDMFSDEASGYLFSLTVKKTNHLYVIHTDTHLKVLAAIRTGTDESGDIDIENAPDNAAAQLFGIASHTISRCIQEPFGKSAP